VDFKMDDKINYNFLIGFKILLSITSIGFAVWIFKNREMDFFIKFLVLTCVFFYNCFVYLEFIEKIKEKLKLKK